MKIIALASNFVPRVSHLTRDTGDEAGTTVVISFPALLSD